jgi:hypothetical protein
MLGRCARKLKTRWWLKRSSADMARTDGFGSSSWTPQFAADMLFNGEAEQTFPRNGRRRMVRFPQLRPLRNPGAVLHAARSGVLTVLTIPADGLPPRARPSDARPLCGQSLGMIQRRRSGGVMRMTSARALPSTRYGSAAILDTARDRGHARTTFSTPARSVINPSPVGSNRSPRKRNRSLEARASKFRIRKFRQQRHAARFEAFGARSPKFAAETRLLAADLRKCRLFAPSANTPARDCYGWLGNEDSNLGMAKSSARERRLQNDDAMKANVKILPGPDLALQLSFCFKVRALSDRLVSSTPE